MILGGINNEKKPIGEVSEIAELRKEVDELKKTVETLKYGLILFALFYLYDKLKK
jgi:cell division protein FtsB